MTGFGGLGFEDRVSGREGRENCAKNAKEYRKTSLFTLDFHYIFRLKKSLFDIFSIANYDHLTVTLPNFSGITAFFNPFGCSFAFFAQLSRPSRPETRY